MDVKSWPWRVDDDLRYYAPPKEKAALLGFPEEIFAGRSMFQFMDAEDAKKARQSFFSSDGTPTCFKNIVCRYYRTDGSLILLSLSGEPFCDSTGAFLGFCGTEQNIAALALHSVSGPTPLLETVYATAPISLCIVDRAGRLLAVNDRHTSLLAGQAGQNLADLHPQSYENAQDNFRLLDRGEAVPIHEVQIGERDYAISVTPLSDARGNLVAISVAHFDITERRRLERELRDANDRLAEQAIRDHLTGAFNRRYFDASLDSEIKRAIRRGGTVSVALVDIDNFKRYNDTYGHVAGDCCLVSVVTAMSKELLRPGDGVYRYGGEEFAVLLPDTDQAAAYMLANQLRAAVFERAIPHANNPPSRTVTISVGVASHHFVPDVGALSGTDLVHQADEALYRAKQNGRNRVEAADRQFLAA